jgi:hypothetical protein
MEETLEGGRGPPRAVVPLERERERGGRGSVCPMPVSMFNLRTKSVLDFECNVTGQIYLKIKSNAFLKSELLTKYCSKYVITEL